MAFPPLSLSSNSASSAKSDGQLSGVFDTPFQFDSSGWNVQIHSSGASQTNTQAKGSGFDSGLLLIAAAFYFLVK